MAKMRKLVLLVIVWVAYSNSSALASPSFSCGGKLSPIEKTICSDKGLSNADTAMSNLFNDRAHDVSDKDRPLLIADQRLWLTAINSDCKSQPPAAATENHNYDVACLLRKYNQRISTLQSWDSPSASANMRKNGFFHLLYSSVDDLCSQMLVFYDIYHNKKIEINQGTGEILGNEKSWLPDHEIEIKYAEPIAATFKNSEGEVIGKSSDNNAIVFDIFREGEGRIIDFKPKWGPHSWNMIGSSVRILRKGALLTTKMINLVYVDVDPDIVDFIYDPEQNIVSNIENRHSANERDNMYNVLPHYYEYGIFMIIFRGSAYFVVQSEPYAYEINVVKIQSGGTVSSVCYIK